MIAWCLKDTIFTIVMTMNSSGNMYSWLGGFCNSRVLWHASSVGYARYVGSDAGRLIFKSKWIIILHV